jgi:RNA polymerase sigma-70 factor (ECF subfamily)
LELKISEIAELLDISNGNVKVLLYRGRKYLRELFEMRCSLIDPKKPCKCHLWIKFMKDHDLEMPKGYEQPKVDELKKEHFKNLNTIKKINYLYMVDPKYKKEDFIRNMKKIIDIM